MTVRILVGNCLDVLRTLRPHSVQCVVTSPPYWGLRDYGAEGQLGLERDPRDYIRNMVDVFREVRRVMRLDGTLWLNMGDSYTDGGRGKDTGSTLLGTRQNQTESRKVRTREGARPFGLGSKQLLMMPARLAIALQEDGWVLRDDIVWWKPNPMPESTQDRPTRAHEFIFLFSPRPRYFYDAKAIAEPVSGTSNPRGESGVGPKSKVPSGWDTEPRRHDGLPEGRYRAGRVARPQTRLRLKHGKSNESFLSAVRALVPMRNKRDVWRILPRAYKGAHFATFPPELARLCIMAGTSPQACELCGAPWRPVYGASVETGEAGSGNKERKYRHEHGGPEGKYKRQAHAVPWKPSVQEITGMRRTCDCSLAAGTGKCLVLDPFGGSGTTAMVAEELGRDSILIEINPEYAELSRRRTTKGPPTGEVSA